MAESLAFREWAKNEGLVKAVPISDFEDAVIGYDAEDFINILLVQEGTREPLLPALGGLPFALRSHIDRELANIEKFTKKKPLFVFNGLDLDLYDRKFVSKESERAVRILEEAWRVYDNGDGDAAVRAFERACKFFPMGRNHSARSYQVLTVNRHISHGSHSALPVPLPPRKGRPRNGGAIQRGSTAGIHGRHQRCGGQPWLRIIARIRH